MFGESCFEIRYLLFFYSADIGDGLLDDLSFYAVAAHNRSIVRWLSVLVCSFLDPNIHLECLSTTKWAYFLQKLSKYYTTL